MKVTEVRIRLVKDDNAEKLRAFATLTLDGEFVVRDMKIIDGNNGYFVAMPSRKVMSRCSSCGGKNAVRASYCNDCGARMPQDQKSSEGGRPKVHVDIAHPITSTCRKHIHDSVIRAYHKACDRVNPGEEYVDDGERRSEPAPRHDSSEVSKEIDSYSSNG